MLLILGGRRTEPDYFRWVKKALSASGLRIEIRGEGWNPERLFQLAVDCKLDNARDARRNRDQANTYDTVWVVTDVDEFAAELRRLIPKQEKSGVKLSISNPCFEAWLNMHYEDSASPVGSREAQDRARQLGLVDPNNPKRIRTSRLEGRFDVARSTAERLTRRHRENGLSFPDDTPSSGVGVLVQYLLEQAQASGAGVSFAL